MIMESPFLLKSFVSQSIQITKYLYFLLIFLHIIQHAGQQVLAVVAEMLAVNR